MGAVRGGHTGSTHRIKHPWYEAWTRRYVAAHQRRATPKSCAVSQPRWRANLTEKSGCCLTATDNRR